MSLAAIAARALGTGCRTAVLSAACLSATLAQDTVPQIGLPENLAASIAASTHVFVGKIAGVSYLRHDGEGNETLSRQAPPGFALGVLLEIRVLEHIRESGGRLPDTITLGLPGSADAVFLDRERQGGGSLVYFVRRETEEARVNGSVEERTRYRLTRIGSFTTLPAYAGFREAIVDAVQRAGPR